LFHRSRPETTRKFLGSSTMKCSGACRCRTDRAPHRIYNWPWALAWPMGQVGKRHYQGSRVLIEVGQTSRRTKESTFR
jgi:hypothetical protein